MKYQIVFTHEARQDIIETENWYEENRTGLGELFTGAFISSLNKIQLNPGLYPNHYSDIKKCIIKKFPYSIYYYIDEKRIVVLGCFHFKRNPSTILNRLK